MNPNPLSRTSRLIVPVITAMLFLRLSRYAEQARVRRVVELVESAQHPNLEQYRAVLREAEEELRAATSIDRP